MSALVGKERGRTDERTFRRALLAGYPDRVARRRAPGSPKALLASGHGAYVGAVQIKQTDFGIGPIKIGGGVVRVKDELDMTFRTYARIP